MDLWSVSHDAIRAAAARKAGVPLWRIGAVRVTSGLYAHARILAGGTVTVTERDVLLAELHNGANPHESERIIP